MDRKAVSFLCVGILAGVLLTSASFALLSRPAETAGTAHGSSPGAPAPRVLKLAHALDPGHPVHAAMEFMAERLKVHSGGQLQLRIYPGGQLGSETDSIEQVQRGALAMAKTSAAALEGFVPEMALFGLPYLFRDSEHYWKVLNSDVGKRLLDAGRNVGLKGVCYYDSGSRSFYSTQSPIMKPADLEGLKIRVMRSKTAMDMVSQLGGSPTPIPWGELYTALQQGMVDGAENNPPSMYSSRHFEVTKFFSLDEHARIPDLVVMSDKIYGTLSPEQQQWLQTAAEESVRFQRKLWEEKTEQALKELRAAGVKVQQPDKAPFVAKVQPMYDQLSDDKLRELVTQVRAQ